MICSKQSAVSSQQKGQSLLEVLTALGVAAILIVGLITLAVYGLRNAQHAKNTETASRLTGQAIEEVRTVRDRQGWNIFAGYETSSPNNCFKVDRASWQLVDPLPAVPGCNRETLASPFASFDREIKLETANADIDRDGDVDAADGENGRKVTVTVFWEDSTGTNRISSETILTQWQ